MTIFALDERDPAAGAPDVDLEHEGQGERERERVVVCADCGHHISDSAARQPFAEGVWQERFVNPHGVLFSVERYARAPGCVGRGAPSTEFSWFAGCSWQIQLCGACLTHLGWLFRDLAGSDPAFFGLRSDKLRELDCLR
ncbi:MAG: hypothetical protein KC503_00045 [Myxococcales bacterium]|nr:hypothetical protein [Myxococcales bacterium]